MYCLKGTFHLDFPTHVIKVDSYIVWDFSISWMKQLHPSPPPIKELNMPSKITTYSLTYWGKSFDVITNDICTCFFVAVNSKNISVSENICFSLTKWSSSLLIIHTKTLPIVPNLRTQPSRREAAPRNPPGGATEGLWSSSWRAS